MAGQMCKPKSIPYLDLNTIKAKLGPHAYQDVMHLSAPGAAQATEIIMTRLVLPNLEKVKSK